MHHSHLNLALLLSALACWPVFAVSAFVPRQFASRLIYVIRPQRNAALNDSIVIGVPYDGTVSRQVSVSLQYPNGTVQQASLIDPYPGECETGTNSQPWNGHFMETMNVEIGQYVSYLKCLLL
jgi:hypothetical protein